MLENINLPRMGKEEHGSEKLFSSGLEPVVFPQCYLFIKLVSTGCAVGYGLQTQLRCLEHVLCP